MDGTNAMGAQFTNPCAKAVGSLRTLPRAAGIYRIRNVENDKVYIGSSRDIRYRAYSHRALLQKDKHYNRHLQNSWNCYGGSAFLFEVVELVDGHDCVAAREQRHIDVAISGGRGRCYNISTDAHTASVETRFKMSCARKGRSTWNKGIPCPEHVKRANALFHKGRKRTPEQCARISEATLAGNHQYRGKHLPAAMRAKLSASKHRAGPKDGRFKGVHFDKRTHSYMARIFASGHQFYLGRYASEEDAAIAYNDAALRHYGNDCYLNSVSSKEGA